MEVNEENNLLEVILNNGEKDISFYVAPHIYEKIIIENDVMYAKALLGLREAGHVGEIIHSISFSQDKPEENLEQDKLGLKEAGHIEEIINSISFSNEKPEENLEQDILTDLPENSTVSEDNMDVLDKNLQKHKMTLVFLELLIPHGNEIHIKSKINKIFRTVSSELEKIGYKLSSKFLLKKWNILLKTYKSENLKMISSGKMKNDQWPYYDIINKIFKTRHIIPLPDHQSESLFYPPPPDPLSPTPSPQPLVKTPKPPTLIKTTPFMETNLNPNLKQNLNPSNSKIDPNLNPIIHPHLNPKPTIPLTFSDLNDSHIKTQPRKRRKKEKYLLLKEVTFNIKNIGENIEKLTKTINNGVEKIYKMYDT